MTYEEFRNLTAGLQSIATTLAIIVGGAWAVRRFIIEREAHPHVEFTADITFIERRVDWWIVELTSTLENKGKVLHRIEKFGFELLGLYADDPIETAPEFGDQVHFPHLITRGSWLPKRFGYFFIEPRVKATYSHIARIPCSATSVIMHSWFDYGNGRSHTAERTVACPSSSDNVGDKVLASTPTSAA